MVCLRNINVDTLHKGDTEDDDDDDNNNNNNNNNNNGGGGSEGVGGGGGGGCDSVQCFSCIRVIISSNQPVTSEHNSTIQQHYLIAPITFVDEYNLCNFFHNDDNNITKTPQHATTRDV
jgi:hypothetical protein